MASVETKLRSLLGIAQHVLDDMPVGILVLSAKGTVLWFNREAEIVCAVWNRAPLRADSLPLKRTDFAVPPFLWTACQEFATKAQGPGHPHAPHLASEADRNLSALIRFLPVSEAAVRPGFYLQLDYRRPRSDRDHPISPTALQLLTRLTFREREVALRVRDGLTTQEIARELRRSPLTIKTQLAAVFRKLGVANRSRVISLLNR